MFSALVAAIGCINFKNILDHYENFNFKNYPEPSENIHVLFITFQKCSPFSKNNQKFLGLIKTFQKFVEHFRTSPEFSEIFIFNFLKIEIFNTPY